MKPTTCDAASGSLSVRQSRRVPTVPVQCRSCWLPDGGSRLSSSVNSTHPGLPHTGIPETTGAPVNMVRSLTGNACCVPSRRTIHPQKPTVQLGVASARLWAGFRGPIYLSMAHLDGGCRGTLPIAAVTDPLGVERVKNPTLKTDTSRQAAWSLSVVSTKYITFRRSRVRLPRHSECWPSCGPGPVSDGAMY